MNKLQWTHTDVTVGVFNIRYELFRFEYWSVTIYFGNNSICHKGFKEKHLAMAKAQAFNDYLTDQHKETYDEGYSEGNHDGMGGERF